MLTYQQRHGIIATQAWKIWTKNGLGLDAEMRRQTEQTVQDAANNTYMDGIDNMEWLKSILARLGE